MTIRAVHWHEGMFLRPHQLQAEQRYTAYLTQRSAKWDMHYNWGLRAIEIDLEALANHRLVIRSLKARLRDGTLVAVPEDNVLPAVELKPAFEREDTLTAYLAVPIVVLGKANVVNDSSADGGRYIIDTQELEDENTGVNPQPIQVRLLNLKLLLSTQNHAGYEVLPIARIKKSARAEATPELDLSYVPPLLACDAWKPLAANIVQTIYNRIGAMLEIQAGQVVDRGIHFESQATGDRLIIEQVRALNEAYALLGVVAFAQGIHPLPVYAELCRLVGQLAIFGKRIGPRAPDLPKYDHDDLGGCYYAVKQYIDGLLDDFGRPEYQERPFIGAGLRMQVTMEPAWLEPAWQMFVGVQSTLSVDDCVKLLTREGGLDMKIGSSGRVDDIFKRGLRGLMFTHTPQPPRALPSKPGLVYFQVDRRSQQEEWQYVQKELTLAIRLNERRIAGNIQGEKILTVKTADKTTTLQLTLFLVPQETVGSG